MTDHEIACARALRSVTFVPATPQKRFAREMAWLMSSDPNRPLTPKQSMWLSSLVWTYRRQINDKPLVAACGIRTHAASYGEADGLEERRRQQSNGAPGRVDVPNYEEGQP